MDATLQQQGLELLRQEVALLRLEMALLRLEMALLRQKVPLSPKIGKMSGDWVTRPTLMPQKAPACLAGALCGSVCASYEMGFQKINR